MVVGINRDKKFLKSFFGRLIFLLACIFFSFCFFIPNSIFAATLDLPDESNFLNEGNSVGLVEADQGFGVSLEAMGHWGAYSWKTPDKSIGVGSAFASDGRYIYVVRGSADILFWRYDTETNTWKDLKNLPRGAYYGADIQYLDGNIYALFGGYQKTFAKYSISNDTWEILSDYPELTYIGTSMTSDGSDIYAITGNNTQSLYRYSVASDTWSPLSGSPLTLRGGADLVHVNGYLYTPRGNNTNVFYRYSIAANSWVEMAVVPTLMIDDVDITTNGTSIFVARQNNSAFFYRYDIDPGGGIGSWTQLKSSPIIARYSGVQYLDYDGYVYFFRGNGQFDFWKYDISENDFIGIPDAPATLGLGSDAYYYEGNVYMVRGGNTSHFYRYNLATNSWSSLEDVPGVVNSDTRGVLIGSSIYMFRGVGGTQFYRYDIGSGNWSTLTAAPAAVNFGGALAYPGIGSYIYATRGGNLNNFWRYNITTDSWAIVGEEPPLPPNLPTGFTASYGSTLFANSTDVFFTTGLAVKKILKYNIASQEWSIYGNLPFSPYYGNDTEYLGGGKVLALAGFYSDELWEYTISANSWRQLKSLPTYDPREIGPWSGASIVHMGDGTFLVTRGNNRADVLTYSSGEKNYITHGTWTSRVYDLLYVESWDNLNVDILLPDGTSFNMETRTSLDSVNWGDWEGVTGGEIMSEESRYLQIRFVLLASSDGTKTPVIRGIEVDYSSDGDPSSLPVNFKGFSRYLNGEELVNGEEYKYTEPYFTWDESEDAEGNVVGYYVYFGPDGDTNPVDDGNFQLANSYRVYQALDIGKNYLRVVAEDESGNLTEAVTGFEYDYNGVGPYLPLEVDASEMLGSGGGFQIVGDVMKLASKEGGFWLEERLTPPPAPMTFHWGSANVAYVENTNKFYIAGNSGLFYEYDITNDVWIRLENTPATISYGGGIVAGPEGVLYAMQGTNTNNFWQYNISQNTWSTEVSTVPLAVGYGGSMVFDGLQYVYVLRGNGSDFFWRYNCLEDTWDSLSRVEFGAPANNLNNNVNRGASLAIDKVRKKIYATQGSFVGGFSEYDIEMNSWNVLTNTPSLPYDGSSLGYDPHTHAVYYQGGNSAPYFFKYDIEEEEWVELSMMPLGLLYGGGVHRAGDSLYAMRGGNTNTFYKYNIEKNSWLIPQRGLFGREYQGTNLLFGSYGADIVKGDKNFFYITRGNYGDDFLRWDEKTGELQRLAKVPAGLYVGGSLVYESKNNKIYATAGTHCRAFFVYDIATNIWEEITTDPLPVVANTGSSMSFDGSRYIYFASGAARNFYRYDIEGASENRWSTLGLLPANIGYGSEMLLKGDYLYALRGANITNNPLYRYQLSTQGPWDSNLSPAPFQLNTEGFLVDGNNGYFYGTRGSNTAEFYRYDVTENSWNQLKNAPANITVGGAGESNMDYAMYMLTGSGTDSYNDGLYTYIFESENSSFVQEAEYISQPHDLESVYKWGEINFDYTLKENTNIIMETSSSDDGLNWGGWIEVSRKRDKEGLISYSINSEPGRYIKVKVSLSSGDGIRSPEFSGYKINYYQDEVRPTNPDVLGISGISMQEAGSLLESGNWYNFATPYFEWPEAEEELGASDGVNGSGIAGYHVYWGTKSNANLEEEGFFQEENFFAPSALSDGSTYYLKFVAIDNAGNRSNSVLDAFTYKYDSRGPNSPTNLVASPSGFTANNSFAFSWDPATTGGPAIVEYCYKTGVETGEYFIDQCIVGTTITNIPAYKVGTNTFYVRAKDEAGNLGNYASVSYFYVDAENAPAPPINLKVTPETSTQNLFGFDWEPPADETFYGAKANLSYLFSVNALPTPQSVSTTSLTYINSGAFATLPGENIFYIVTRDEAGNVNYNNYEKISFFANTVAPGIPMDMEIADVSVKSAEAWRLAISWDSPLDEGSGVHSYKIYRSADGKEFELHTSTGGTSLVDSKLVQQVYYYKVQACDSTNNCGEFSNTVSLYPDGRYTESAELIVEPLVSNITPKKATVSWITDRTSDSRIAYGLEPGIYFEEEVSNSEHVIEHVLSITNLSPGTQYYYIVKWTDEDGNTGVSEEGFFETDPPPTIEEPVVKRVGLNSALIEFTTRQASKVRIFYGETSAFGGMTEVYTGTQESTHNVELNDLDDGTKYYYQINTFDIDGAEYDGETHSFETLPRPDINDVRIYQVAGTATSTLLVEWETNTPVSSIVTYYPTSNPERVRDEVNVALKAGKHRMVLFNLEANAQYSINVRGQDFMGNEASSGVINYSTASDTRPPRIFDLEVTSEIIGSGPEATAQLVVAYKTDEPATSQVEYGEGTGTSYAHKTQEDRTYSTHHIVIISGLVPGRVYHLRGVSADEAKNIGYSIDKVVVTPQSSDNAFDLVINNLRSIFSFLERGR